jgi:hypothetical protein
MCYTLLCFFSIEHIKITFLIGLSQNIKKALQLKKTPLNVDFIKFGTIISGNCCLFSIAILYVIKIPVFG